MFKSLRVGTIAERLMYLLMAERDVRVARRLSTGKMVKLIRANWSLRKTEIRHFCFSRSDTTGGKRISRHLRENKHWIQKQKESKRKRFNNISKNGGQMKDNEEKEHGESHDRIHSEMTVWRIKKKARKEKGRRWRMKNEEEKKN